MILQQLTDRIFYLPHDSERDRPTLGYIKGDNFSVMIDCGTSSEHLELFNKGLQERNLPLPKLAIVTHWHWDHSFGMRAFDGLTIANKLTNDRLQIMKEWIWTDDAMKERLQSGDEIEFCDHYIRLEYPNLEDIKLVSADIVFEDSLTIDLGGIHCEINMIGWQHSADSNLIYIPEEKVFFVGDADSEDFYNNDGKYNPTLLKETINYWENQDFNWHIHGHLKPATKVQILEYLREQLSNQ